MAAQLFRLYDGADTTMDLSEANNVADQYPEKLAELLSDLNEQIAAPRCAAAVSQCQRRF